MPRGRTTSVLVTRLADGAARRSPDELAVEEPMEIRLDGNLVSTTMRTPGHDFELAVGLCFADGLLAGAPVSGVRYCATGTAAETGFNVVTVETDGLAPMPSARLTTTTTSCGLCGSQSLTELQARLAALPADQLVAIAPDVLASVPDRVRAEQSLFARTGAVHAAAAFGPDGTPVLVREDVGRHNAVDKVVGRLLLDGELPAHELGLFVSGRASFELVQKAWAAGFAALVAVSAPTSLAVEAARSAGLTLAGFARPGSMNIYAPGAFGVVSIRQWDRSSWVGLSPNGIGSQKPNHYLDMVKVAVANRQNLPYAWKVLTKGVCDGCALGVAGFHDWTLEGVHLCTTRLKLLEVNTADPLDHDRLADVAALRTLSGQELRALGRLAFPMRRRRGEPGFRRISWDEALGAVAHAVRTAGGERSAMYLTSRGLTNEVYYAAGKAARAMGIAGVDSAARVRHAPSSFGLKSTIGVAASTCSLQDVLETDLVVLWGTNVANNQPVFTKYLYLAKKRGARVVVVNPYLEPGLERYWVPSNAESALFGTKLCDLHVPVRPGGDVPLANALVKRLVERDAVDRDFVAAHTEGWAELEAAVTAADLDELLAAAGITRGQLEAFVDEYAAAAGAVLVWSMGITQHRTGVENVQAIVNVGLARGNVGRNGAGLMPIRGHSGVQGGAEMGAYATALPGNVPVDAEHAAALSELWGFEVPPEPGLTAPEQVEAAERGELDVLWLDGGNFLDVLPDPPRVAAALERVPLRVHMDIVLSSQMLLDGDDVILLPARTRYEQEGGGTETTTERRIAFSPELPREVGEARSEWRVYAELAARVRPELVEHFAWPTNRDLRSEIARVVPAYDGIQYLEKSGDAIQWGGRHLCAGGVFPTPSGRGRFTVLDVQPPELPAGTFLASTRRGRQFNSMVFDERDPLTGASRDAVYIDEADAATLGLQEGSPVRLVAVDGTGTYDGRLKLVRLPSRSVQVHWPEGNVLLGAGPDRREPKSHVPDYNAVVRIDPR